MIFKSVIANVNTFRMEKVTRGLVIISRGGIILRDHMVFQVLKERGGRREGDYGALRRMRHISS